MTYQEWGVIADSYIPLLGISFIITIVRTSLRQNWATAKQPIFGILLSICFIYGLMWLDQIMTIWPRLGLDYSTHTALALVFVVYFSLQSTKQCFWAIFSMVLYCLLMRYQQYHSVIDIITTSIITLPIIYLVQLKTNQINNNRKS
ncbi:hypothetical protein [uncultured Shewanella sp.]|uniref:hypothetical protein n=1 Tax=uncultured Shewanella sp. TaxID=173975 RepID=UPI00260FFC99|nr:hypothetical protein [uncultured Shewanella sp.]